MSKRSELLRRVAYEREMEFFQEDDWRMIALLRDFRLFRRGSQKRITNILRQRDPMHETELNVFDYHYAVQTNNATRHVNQSVFFVNSKLLALPEFRMQPEQLLHLVGSWLGFDDIDFEKYPEFSDAYYLKGKDEEMIRHVMRPRLLNFFTVERNWHVEGVGYFLVMYKHRGLFKPHRVHDLIDKGQRVMHLLSDRSPS